jgi:hypothetical protein
LFSAHCTHKRAHSIFRTLGSAGHPVLFIGSGETGPTIAVDNEAGIFEAVGHLIQHNHQRIAFLAGSPDDMLGDTGERLRAFESALSHFGLESDPFRVAFGRHVYDGGYAGTLQIIESGAPFSAIVASNDEMALGAMQALKERGCRVPHDVAVIGFDNRLEGTTQEPALSTVHVPLYEMGYRSVELMHAHFHGRQKLNGTVKVSSRLVIRQSCGCSRSALLPDVSNPSYNLSTKIQWAQLIDTMVSTVLNQAQSLSEEECHFLCQHILDSFSVSIKQNDSSRYFQSLNKALEKTAASGDDAHIWQDAITLLVRFAQTNWFSSCIISHQRDAG